MASGNLAGYNLNIMWDTTTYYTASDWKRWIFSLCFRNIGNKLFPIVNEEA